MDITSFASADGIAEPKPALVSDIELEIKKTELEIKRLELKNGPTSIWRNPAILATLAAANVGIATALVTFFVATNQTKFGNYKLSAQLQLDSKKYESQLALDKQKNAASVILEMIKTGDPDRAAENLRFLIEAGLVEDRDGRIIKYLQAHSPGTGAIIQTQRR